MAGVRSLAVRGIRSFGPDENDEQRISFYQPLTLILGQNGCGKTTIIECLRYAITGQMPPGSRNECFVHDAKVNRTTEVLGQVKLKIVNANDKQLEVSRTMKVTALQKKKPKFQTLDSFLSVIDENGKTKDISSRCADMDSLMYEELGVSKAILNSVIFCHQEDASWPLDEGKKVKERFDEIFDSDKYSECFDRLRKIGKEYAQSIKILEHEVAHLTEKKADLDKIKLEVVNTETSVSDAESKVTELTNELKPMADKLSAIKVLEKNLQSIESKKEKIKIKLEHNQTQEEELKKAITNLFEGTMEELQTAIQTYAATVKSKQKELEESYKQNTTFNNEEMKIANEKADNEAQFNKLIMLENQNQEKIDSKYKMIVNVGKIAEIELSEVTNEEEANKALTELALKISNMLRNVEAQREMAQEEEKKLQDMVDASRDALSRHKQKISGKENELKTIKKDIAKVEKDINSANESKTRLEAMEQKMKAAEDEYRQTENELNVEECQEEINQDEKAVESHEQELNQLDEKVSKLQKQSTKIKERDMTEDSLKQTEKQLTVLKNKHRSALTELLGQMPENSFAISVNKFECTTRDEVDSIKQKQKEKQLELTKCEADRKHVRDTLNKRRTALTKAEDQIYKACGAQSYKATLEKLTASVEKLQEDQNVLQSSMFIFAKYKAQLKDNNCCPLCNRGFDAENEVTDLIQQLTTQVMNVPTKLEKVTEELQRTSAKKDELLSMKSVSENITTLKEEIPQLESRLSELDKGIASLSENLEELSMSMIDPEQRLQTAQRIQGDMTLLDRYTTEHKNTLKELERMKEACAEFECDMSLDEASAKQTDLRQKASTLRARIKTAHQRINAHNKKLSKAADRKNKLKEDMLNLQKKVQEICNLQESLKNLEEKRESIIAEAKELEEGTAALETTLKEMNLEKTSSVNKSRESLDEKRNNLSSLQVSFERVMSMDLEIKKHEALKTHEKMDQIKAANDKLEEKQKQIMVDRATLTKRIDTLKDEISKQEVYKRDLDDNLKLRKAQVEIENCGKEMEEVEEKFKGLNRDSLQEKEALMTEYDKKLREKTYTGGKLSTLKDTLEKQRNELKRALKKDIEARYKEKYYELHVSKAIDKDIKEYSVALEKCVMEFHKEKMENINLIIREMWRKIYRGNDIDHIEIKTESAMTADSDRRKYDYRVVQWKNGVEIDMRGRCSAGQKVLACLIIRLALAETFSSKFGILALDEPTTNLDHENITSLCSALGEIVQDRMTQKNFMFIIITHDKEFIESLGNIDKVSHYYEVARNEHGKSRIKKIRFS